MPTQHRGARTLLYSAALVVVLAGLKAAQAILVPFLVAAFLAILCIPPMRRLQRHRVPEWLALVLVMLGAVAFVLLISLVIGTSATDFAANADKYQLRLGSMVSDLAAWVSSFGFDVDAGNLAKAMDGKQIVAFISSTASELVSALSNVFLVVITMIFILLEVNGLTRKLLVISGPDLSEYTRATKQIQRYLATKAGVSLGTAALVGILCFACGVDFPLLWALLAFFFNFVPNIGSIIAAIPAIMVTLLDMGPGRAAIVGAGYLLINVVIGNGIEPKLMGRRLGLSTLVVFLSLVFWSFILGPVGMLLSVPLTVVAKIVLEHSDDFKSIAVLLGPGTEEALAAPPPE